MCLIGGLFEIQTYSLFFLKNNIFQANTGGIFQGIERATFEILSNMIFGNNFRKNSKLFIIKKMSTGSIKNCLIMNQKGESDGYILTIDNSLIELVFKVIFS